MTNDQEQQGPRASASPHSLAELLQQCRAQGFCEDLAVLNLACASDLPGAAVGPIDRYLDWLDEAAKKVKLATDRNYHKFLESPGTFDNSQARFCMVCLVTVLQQQCSVRYNPKWQGLVPSGIVPRSFGIHAGDLFIHAIIEGVGGTCASLPVLYIAVGRRLGYPLRLVKAARHLFVRWDDRNGQCWFHADRFNVEATGPGVHFLPDEHYRSWPHAISDDDIDAGIFLRSLATHEEFAEFVATRGCCLQANGRLREAVEAFAAASRLAPNNRYFSASYESLRRYLVLRQRAAVPLGAPLPFSEQRSIGPFWLDGFGAEKLLVQVVSPVAQPEEQLPRIGLQLERQFLQTPTGLHVEAWVPTVNPAWPMTASWLRLPDGRYALVHRKLGKSDFWPAFTGPIHSRGTLPEVRHVARIAPGPPMAMIPQAEETAVNDGYLASQIDLAVDRMNLGSMPPSFSGIQSLAIPAGPCSPGLACAGTYPPVM